MDLAGDELLTRIRLPRTLRWLEAFLSQSGNAPRAGDLESLLRRVCAAETKSRVALGSVAPVPLLLEGAFPPSRRSTTSVPRRVTGCRWRRI